MGVALVSPSKLILNFHPHVHMWTQMIIPLTPEKSDLATIGACNHTFAMAGMLVPIKHTVSLGQWIQTAERIASWLLICLLRLVSWHETSKQLLEKQHCQASITALSIFFGDIGGHYGAVFFTAQHPSQRICPCRATVSSSSVWHMDLCGLKKAKTTLDIGRGS